MDRFPEDFREYCETFTKSQGKLGQHSEAHFQNTGRTLLETVIRLRALVGSERLPQGDLRLLSGNLFSVTAKNGREVFVVRVSGGVGTGPNHLYAAERLRRASPTETCCVPQLLWASQSEAFALYAGRASGVITNQWVDDAVHARALGRSIGRLHRSTPMPGRDLEPLGLGEWLSCAWPLPGHDELMVTAAVSLMTEGGRHPKVPVHGLLGTDRVLTSSTGAGMPSVLVMNWDEFHNGDAAQDVGGFVGDCLSRCWPRSFPAGEGSHGWITIDAVLDAFDVRRPLVESFWRGYGEVRIDTDDDLPRRAVAFAGWSLFARVVRGRAHGRHLTQAERVAAGIGRAFTVTPHHFVALLGLGAP